MDQIGLGEGVYVGGMACLSESSEQELRETLPHLQAGHRSQARYIRLIYVYIGRILSGGRTLFS